MTGNVHGMKKKLKVAVLKKHNLLKCKMNKSERVQVINAWLSMQLLKATKHSTEEKHEEESSCDEDSDTEKDPEYSSDEETDIVTHKVRLEEDDDRGHEAGK